MTSPNRARRHRSIPPCSSARSPCSICPEFAGWFLDPEALQSDSVALLQTRESRLVVSDQVKAEREAAIVDGVVERELTPEARRRWARRLEEMALILAATDRAEQATWATAAAAGLRDEAREIIRHPFDPGPGATRARRGDRGHARSRQARRRQPHAEPGDVGR